MELLREARSILFPERSDMEDEIPTTQQPELTHSDHTDDVHTERTQTDHRDTIHAEPEQTQATRWIK